MKRDGLKCSANPDVFVAEFQTKEALKESLSDVYQEMDTVRYRLWKKVKDGDKMRWKEVEECVQKQEFIEIVLEESEKFRMHVTRVKHQYGELRELRKKLPPREVVIWMDFAENYNCSSVKEVQSAYWNSQMISLHTMVVYLPEGHSKKVQSYVAISNAISHNATVVFTILNKLLPLVKIEVPDIERIHYLTDSPSSQYRNKTIFQIVCDHEVDFGIKARWNYLETGHGKGPCDGLGASVKRMADMAVKQQKCSIQDAYDFYEWAVDRANETKVKYIKYTEEDIEAASTILKAKQQATPIPGTMKLHAVVPIDTKTIAIRELSCYCDNCLLEFENTQCSWERKSLYAPLKRKTPEPEEQREKTHVEVKKNLQKKSLEKKRENERNDVLIETKINDWVAAVYEDNWFIGQVTDIDEEDCNINFLTSAGKYGNAFKFPPKKEIWINKTDILCVLHELQEIGKARKCYRLSKLEENSILTNYAQFKDSKRN